MVEHPQSNMHVKCSVALPKIERFGANLNVRRNCAVSIYNQNDSPFPVMVWLLSLAAEPMFAPTMRAP
jgi:hypothetical protein